MKLIGRQKVMNGILFLLGYFVGTTIMRYINVRQTILKTGPCQNVFNGIIPHRPSYGPRGLLMIGVMTTRSRLATRASAIYSTWGRNISAFIVFYIGQNSTQEPLNDETDRDEHVYKRENGKHFIRLRKEPVQFINYLPVVELQGVNDDGHPPRDKSFAMLSHMVHRFGRHYQWFLRSDDDVFVRVETMETFLKSLNSSLPWHLGQPAKFPMSRKRGRFGLKRMGTYCMDGPGAVFSYVTLQRLVPHLQDCAGEEITAAGGTGIGKCVLEHLGIPCTSYNTKVSRRVSHSSQRDAGNKPSHGTSNLILQPVENASLMYKLHVWDQLRQLQDLQRHEQQLVSNLRNLNRRLASIKSGLNHNGITGFSTHNSRRAVQYFTAAKPSLQESTRKSSWSSWHVLSSLDAFRLMDWLTPKDDEVLVSSDFQNDELLEENPVWSLAVRKRIYSLMGSKTYGVMPNVTRMALNQIFHFTKAHGSINQYKKRILAQYHSYTLTQGLQHFITLARGDKGYQSFLLTSRFEELHWREISVKQDTTAHDDSTQTRHRLQKNSDTVSQHGSRSVKSSWPQLHVLLTLVGRHQIYLRFLDYLTAAATRYPAQIHLHVTVYADPLGEHELSGQATEGNQHLNVTVLNMPGNFSRATGLTAATKGLDGSSVLIFMDVDMIFNEQFLYRAASHVVDGYAYFPVCYSQYSPETVCYGSFNCTPAPFDFSQDSGFWRVFGNGLFAIQASEFWRAGGFNTSIVGWGLEDIDFYIRGLVATLSWSLKRDQEMQNLILAEPLSPVRCVKHSIRVLRAPDPGLVHVYHYKSCDPALSPEQLKMCKGSLYSLYGSSAKLTEMVLDVEHLQ